MSGPLALGAVTAVLQSLLNENFKEHQVDGVLGKDATVSALAPELLAPGGASAATPPQLNLFLYQVQPNCGWRQVGLPSRDLHGDRVTSPPLALDLCYLVTAYGASDIHAEVLLGYAMQFLHEVPVLTRSAITSVLEPATPPTGGLTAPVLKLLADDGLAAQVEQIRLTPHYLKLEELSQLWSALGAAYRPSAAYQASVVLVESRRKPRTPLPVRQAKLYVVPLGQPQIERLLSLAPSQSEPAADQPIFGGYTLVIRGQNLRGPFTSVRLGGLEQPESALTFRTGEIRVPIPPALRAGLHGVQVIHRMPMGEPAQPHRFVESNLAALVLRPQIATTAGGADEIAQTVTATGGLVAGTIAVTLVAAVGPAQRAVLVLNKLETPVDRAARTYSFDAEPRSGAGTLLEFTIDGVEAGGYLLRVQVDGAETALRETPQRTYDGPKVTLP